MTVPATDTTLDSFTFFVDLPTTLIFRGEVYAWNPNTGDPNNPYLMGNATGPALYESSATHTTKYIPIPGSAADFQLITFNTGGIPLTAGQQYVLFFTISKNYQADAPTAGMKSWVAVTAADTIPGGNWVYINNFCTTSTTNDCGGDTSLWTTTPWSNQVGLGTGEDLAFAASFSPPLPTSKAQCMNGGWKTYVVFKNQGACVSFVARGGKPPA